MKLFNVHLYHVCPKTGVKTDGYNHGRKQNATPMEHDAACRFKSAIDMNRKGISFELVEVK